MDVSWISRRKKKRIMGLTFSEKWPRISRERDHFFKKEDLSHILLTFEYIALYQIYTITTDFYIAPMQLKHYPVHQYDPKEYPFFNPAPVTFLEKKTGQVLEKFSPHVMNNYSHHIFIRSKIQMQCTYPPSAKSDWHIW